jgi:hypothetical protein
VVLAATAAIGLLTYLLLDTPWTRMREQQRPRFISVRILYLNTLILAGFWLAVMFAFSAADPSLTTNVSQRLPELLDMATARDYAAVVQLKHVTAAQAAPGAAVSTWFDVFLHGIISAVTVNLILYGLVVARRRMRVHGRGTAPSGCATTPTSACSSMENAAPSADPIARRLSRWRSTVGGDDLAAWSAVAALTLYVTIALAGGGGRTLTVTYPLGCLVVALFAYVRSPATYVGFVFWCWLLSPFCGACSTCASAITRRACCSWDRCS